MLAALDAAEAIRLAVTWPHHALSGASLYQKTHLPESPETATGRLCDLFGKLDTKAEFPGEFPPADVLAALAPLGECWELRYLRQQYAFAPFKLFPVLSSAQLLRKTDGWFFPLETADPALMKGSCSKCARILSETAPDVTSLKRLVQLTVPWRRSCNESISLRQPSLFF